MMRLIGFRWKPCEGLSREVLMNLNTILSFFTSVGNRKLLTSSEPFEKALITGRHSLGGSCDRGTPDPISNSEVKPVSADGTSL